MTTSTPRGFWVAASLLTIASVRAQHHSVDTVSVAGGACGLSTVNAGLRGGGPDYRATFDTDGFEFTPALGSRARRSYPLRLTLEAIVRGTAAVYRRSDDPAPSHPSRSGHTARFARGNGVIERFDVRPDGVAWSFKFHDPLPGHGDLVVRARVTTELAPSPTSTTTEGVRFAAGDGGGVSIGLVTGIDARGRRVAGGLHLDGDTLELSLPAHFVERATYPLVLDPLIGSLRTVASGRDDTEPDTSYDATTGSYLVVWQRELSATDIEVRGQRLDASGRPIGSMISITSGAGVALRPRVGSVNGSDRWLVVWQRGATPFGPWEVRGRAVDAATGALSTGISLATGTGNDVDPDIGSEVVGGIRRALVVWRRIGAGIRAAPVEVPTTGAPAPLAEVTVATDSTSGIHEQPAISKSGGRWGIHLLAWVTRETARPDRSKIHAIAIDRDGNVLTGVHPVFDSTGNVAAPATDGDGNRFAVAWHRETRGGDRDVFCRTVVYDQRAGTLVDRSSLIPIADDNAIDESEPAIAFLGPKFLCAWRASTGLLQSTIAVRALDLAACGACGPLLSLGSATRFNTGVAIGARTSGRVAPQARALIVFGSLDRTPPFRGDVLAQDFRAIGAGGTVVDLGGGCGAGGTAQVSGPFAIGNTDFRVELTGAVGTVTNLDIAIGIGSTISCGPCDVLLPLFTTPAQPIVSGTAADSIPVPCDLGLIGGVLECQWLSITPSANPCPLVGGVSLSNRLRLTIGL